MKNHTAIISGASSGLGAQIAQKFSSEGYAVLLLGRDLKKLQMVQKLCFKKQKKKPLIEVLAFNLIDLAAHAKSLQKILEEQLPPVKILVNNAGIFKRENFATGSLKTWQEQFQINLFSAVELTQLVWPQLKKNQGSIVNIASTLGLKPTSGTGAYSASKAAMINWTLNLAQEGGAEGIRANCICPGIVDTPIQSFHSLNKIEKNKVTEQIKKLQLLQQIGQPQHIAEAAYFLGSDLSNWTTGAILNVDGGIQIK